MPSFSNMTELKASLVKAGLGDKADRVIETATPCLRFLRIQEPDDTERLLRSRIGGNPSLPKDFNWPMRPAFEDAAERAAQLDSTHQSTIETMTPEFWQQTIDQMREFVSEDDLASMVCPYTPEMIDGIRKAHEAVRASLFKPMPLSFIAQINLWELSNREGFEPELPKSGMLLFFHDISTNEDEGGVAIYLENDLDQFEARSIPPELIEFHKAHFQSGDEIDNCDKCEVLHPHVAISVPNHWNRSSYGTDMMDWFDTHDDRLLLSSETLDSGDFGDQLGGWPEDVQDHPEFDMERERTRNLFEPGDTPWRMVFSCSAEFFAGTKLLPFGGDGQTYWMMHKDELSAGMWHRLKSIYQQT